MADDRIDSEELPLTHEFLAIMLAVRRPGVMVAVQELEREGLITKKTGAHHSSRPQRPREDVKRDLRSPYVVPLRLPSPGGKSSAVCRTNIVALR